MATAPKLESDKPYLAAAVDVLPSTSAEQERYTDVRIRLVGSGNWLAVTRGEGDNEVTDVFPLHRVAGIIGVTTLPPGRAVIY